MYLRCLLVESIGGTSGRSTDKHMSHRNFDEMWTFQYHPCFVRTHEKTCTSTFEKDTNEAVLKATSGAMSLQRRKKCGAGKVGQTSCPHLTPICSPGWYTGMIKYGGVERRGTGGVGTGHQADLACTTNALPQRDIVSFLRRQ